MDISHTPVGVRAPMPCNTIRLPTHWPTLRKALTGVYDRDIAGLR